MFVIISVDNCRGCRGLLNVEKHGVPYRSSYLPPPPSLIKLDTEDSVGLGFSRADVTVSGYSSRSHSAKINCLIFSRYSHKN